MQRVDYISSLALLLTLATSVTYGQLNRFDYVVIGAGTSGLVVANRLSELRHITVAVIEAGQEQRNNPNVTSGGFGNAGLNTAIDWQYESVNQTHAAGQRLVYHAGKAFGGTSTINGMTYVRAEDVQIDAWEAIGNKGWNWDSLFPYYKKSERFQPPTVAQVASGASYVAQFHGERGPLDVGFSYELVNGSLPHMLNRTWREFGIPFSPDVNGGHMRGFTVWPSTFDVVANVREDSARAYYYPVQSRRNLYVFNDTIANKIIWDNSSSGDAVARGVEVTASDGTIHVIYARREVVLSAGSLRSPAILEHSGVGNPAIMSKYGISTKIALPAVGENLQDQTNNALYYTSVQNTTGYAPFVAFLDLPDLFGNATAELAASTNASIRSWAAAVSDANANAVNASALEYLFQVQHNLIFKHAVSSAELITSSSGNLLGSALWGLLPFSRGNVHIGSPDPLVAIAKLAREFWATAPASTLPVAETEPGLTTVPENASDAQWAAWVKRAMVTNNHPVGTTAMMPRDLGGVVDERLRVYETRNVRVVDASVMPFQVSGHLTSTLYAIAEKASDLIKADIEG